MFISQFMVRNYSYFSSSCSAKLRKWAFSSFLLIGSPAVQRQHRLGYILKSPAAAYTVAIIEIGVTKV